MTQTVHFVTNDHNEAFSNLREPKAIADMDVQDLRDFVFEDRRRAEEVLEYIEAFESEPIRGVAESVEREMRKVARENWSITTYEIETTLTRV